MIEILVLLRLSRKIGETVWSKGHKKFAYQLLLWVLWFGGEIMGGITGAIVSMGLHEGDEPSPGLIYLFALAGAVIGALTAFAIANNLKPVTPDELYPLRDDRDERWKSKRDDDPYGDRGREEGFTDQPAPRRDDHYRE
jgi:hypothetical protein